MRIRKNKICILLVAALLAALFCACGQPSEPPAQVQEGSVKEPTPEAESTVLPAETPEPTPDEPDGV